MKSLLSSLKERCNRSLLSSVSVIASEAKQSTASVSGGMSLSGNPPVKGGSRGGTTRQGGWYGYFLPPLNIMETNPPTPLDRGVTRIAHSDSSIVIRGIKGFTLVELMIVIAIIGVLAASLFPMMSNYMAKARNAARVSDIRHINLAIQSFQSDTGRYPTGAGYALNTEEEITDNLPEWRSDLGKQLEGVLPKIPEDPVKSMSYSYGSVSDAVAFDDDGMIFGGLGTQGDLAGTYSLYYTLEGMDESSLFSSLFLSASDSLITTKEPKWQIRDSSLDSTKTFYKIGHGGLTSSSLIPVDSSKTYRFSGKFRSAGIGPSKMYVGLQSFDEKQNNIPANKVLSNGTAGTVSTYISGSLVLTLGESPTGWKGAGARGGERQIGFYYDGDTTKLPDAVVNSYPTPCVKVGSSCYYNTSPDYGAYSTIAGNTVNLNRPLPASVVAKIIPGVTKVMSHQSGGSYQYIRYLSSLPSTWTIITSNSMTGENRGGSATTFRKGVKYVKFVILPNYAQNTNYELEFTDMLFERLD